MDQVKEHHSFFATITIYSEGNSYKCLVHIIVLQKADHVPNGVAGNQPVAINMDEFHNQQYQNQMYEEQVSCLSVYHYDTSHCKVGKDKQSLKLILRILTSFKHLPYIQDTYIQSRATAMESIESTIVELGGIFQQLAHMVKEQEEQIER